MTEQIYAPERRPLATRNRAWAGFAASWLEKRNVSPNAISIVGMIAGIGGGAAFAVTSWVDWPRLCFLLAALGIQLRLLANMLDGMVAMQAGKASPVGELYNEVPDRISDVAIIVGAGYSLGGQAELGWSAACLALFIAYLRAQGKAAGAHQEFCGPMAKPQRMALLTGVAVYCGIFPAEWQPSLAALPAWGLPALGLSLLIVGSLVTAVRRLLRIARALTSQLTNHR